MSKFNRKGFTTVRQKDKRGNISHRPVPLKSKAASIARRRNKMLARQRKQRVDEYKSQLRTAKKRYPIEQRSHMRLEDF